MSASTPPKRPAASTNSTRRQPSTNSTTTINTTVPNRSPSRMAPTSTSTSTTNVNSAPNGLNRAKSVRSGGVVSARAAVRKPAESDVALDEVKAEMQARLDELYEKLQHVEQSWEDSQKQAAILQVKLDEARKEQGTLEESVHEHTERVEELENEKRESLRARREFEQIYEAERAATMREKEEAQLREEEMQTSLQRMKETLAQREMRAGLDDDRRPSVARNSSFPRSPGGGSPNRDAGQFAPPSSLQRSDSRSSSKLVMQKDKIIESLRMELAEAQFKIVEVENMGGGQLQELQRQMYETKIQNARLMEENESFQLLLSEKTLNGDFAQSDLLRPRSNNGSRPPSRQPHAGTSLADELEAHSDEEGGSEDKRRLQGQVDGLKDQNKALTLYINNIISRLLQHEQFEQILDKTPDLMAGPAAYSRRLASEKASDTDKELPPPPPPKDDDESEKLEQPAGLLQRARSVMGAKKPRPISQIFSSTTGAAQPIGQPDEPKMNENPDTAPRVPIGRSASTRGGHRRANSEWAGAASVVTSMYRGPQPGFTGPTSPGLTTAGNRNSFFASAQPLGLGSRSASGNIITVAPSADRKENADPTTVSQRDSKVVNPNRNSVISSAADPDSQSHADSSSTPELLSNPSSPPRSTASSGDGSRNPGGAIMMGSKMRPLRLVQEANTQDEAAKKAANLNRGSWFGWMNKGGTPTPTTPTSASIPSSSSGPRSEQSAPPGPV
nr:hypothetical protein CFP56_75517 [Quercus suber]